VSLYCCGYLWTGVGGPCSAGCSEVQLGESDVSEMAFGLCRYISVYYRPETEF
jgi:hypothetical protein